LKRSAGLVSETHTIRIAIACGFVRYPRLRLEERDALLQRSQSAGSIASEVGQPSPRALAGCARARRGKMLESLQVLRHALRQLGD
jgi:hypothetical protein